MKLRQKTKKQLQQGFTLIELLIVVAIVGILAAVAVPQYNDYVEESRESEIHSVVQGYKTAVGVCRSRLGTFTGCDSGAEGIPAAIAAGSYENLNTLSVDDGQIEATATSSAGGGTYCYTPSTVGGATRWTVTNAACS